MTLKVTADQALTDECFERLCPEMTAKGWQLSNAPVFTASTELEDSLLITPTTLVAELQQWTSDVAATVVDAIGVWGNHLRNTQRLKESTAASLIATMQAMTVAWKMGNRCCPRAVELGSRSLI